jgi:hypothetical protein
MKLNHYLLMLLLLSSSQILFAQNNLTVADPQKWGTYQGTIDEATLTIRPKGIYTECTAVIQYSSRGTIYVKPTDTTEIVHYFTLPANAAVIDSWLWVNDVPERANLLDRYTASQIYEGIVKRRKDPSILMKNSATQYEFRIFPLQGSSNRKVKLTFLMPTTLLNDEMKSVIPMNLFWNTRMPTKSITIKVFENERIKYSNLSGNYQLEDKNDPVLGKYKEVVLTGSVSASTLDISYKTPLKNNYFVAKHNSSAKEGHYQFVLNTEQMFDLPKKPKKVMVVLDVNSGNTSNHKNIYLNDIKKVLQQKYTSNDSIMFAYANFNFNTVAKNWQAITNENLDEAVSKLKTEFYREQIPNTLTSAISLLKSTDKDVQILWVNASANYDLNESNAIINQVKKLKNIPPIHVLDLTDKNAYYNYWSNKSYYGNGYIYEYIALYSGVIYELNNYYYYNEKMNNIGKVLHQTKVEDFDLSTTLQDGYTSNRFSVAGTDITKQIVQVGKFNGTPPFTISLAAKINDSLYYKKLVIEEKDIVTIDSTVKQTWTALKLFSNEYDYNLTKAQVLENVKLSIANRVLFRHTAFLALEPVIQPTPNGSTGGGGGGTSTSDNKNDVTWKAKAFPNPFQDDLNIEITEAAENEEANVEIFNTNATLVYKSALTLQSGKATLIWEDDSIAAGVYIVKITIGKTQKVLRVVKL